MPSAIPPDRCALITTRGPRRCLHDSSPVPIFLLSLFPLLQMHSPLPSFWRTCSAVFVSPNDNPRAYLMTSVIVLFHPMTTPIPQPVSLPEVPASSGVSAPAPGPSRQQESAPQVAHFPKCLRDPALRPARQPPRPTRPIAAPRLNSRPPSPLRRGRRAPRRRCAHEVRSPDSLPRR